LYLFKLCKCMRCWQPAIITIIYPVTNHGGPQGCETLRLPHFLDNGSQMAVSLSALRASHPLLPGRFLVLISVRDWVHPRAIVWLEGLG
jgi:hypothetical protein